MKITRITAALMAASLFAGPAFAQTRGEVEPEKAAGGKVSAAEKDAGKARRKAEGTAVARASKVDESRPEATKVVSKEERKEAAIKRKADAAEAVRKGQVSSGEK